jgi:hypothetical protein
MTIKTIILAVTILLGALFANFCFAQEPVETISYDIRPIGVCEYQDFGPVEYHGSKANLCVFKTKVAGFEDKEVIFSDAQTQLPVLVKRDIAIWLHNEKITEEYFPKENSLKLTKFEGGKKTEEYFIKGKAPIQSAILVPFSLRNAPELKIGSTFYIVFPQEFRVKLVSLEEVIVPAGKFKTYHFTSTPAKFEIWISADELRLPVKIKGLGAFSYTLEMKKRVAKKR